MDGKDLVCVGVATSGTEQEGVLTGINTNVNKAVCAPEDERGNENGDPEVEPESPDGIASISGVGGTIACFVSNGHHSAGNAGDEALNSYIAIRKLIQTLQVKFNTNLSMAFWRLLQTKSPAYPAKSEWRT